MPLILFERYVAIRSQLVQTILIHFSAIKPTIRAMVNFNKCHLYV